MESRWRPTWALLGDTLVSLDQEPLVMKSKHVLSANEDRSILWASWFVWNGRGKSVCEVSKTRWVILRTMSFSKIDLCFTPDARIHDEMESDQAADGITLRFRRVNPRLWYVPGNNAFEVGCITEHLCLQGVLGMTSRIKAKILTGRPKTTRDGLSSRHSVGIVAQVKGFPGFMRTLWDWNSHQNTIRNRKAFSPVNELRNMESKDGTRCVTSWDLR
jgi:hypothetical protein